jgi:hypothetical protein
MYARYTSIVQSSGMGKSRAIDELSKKHLVVPLCLREGSNGKFSINCEVVQTSTLALGFPPADENVRHWFLLYTGETKRTAYGRAGAFLCALFVTLDNYLGKIDEEMAAISPNVGPSESQAAKFRLLMKTGQTFHGQGEPRKKFYDEVLRLADKVCSLCLIL